MGKRWSKLQKKIDDLVDPALDFQIHCVKYRVPGHGGMQEFPRYFVTLDGKTIFDWPKDYPLGDSNCGKLDISCLFFGRASDISDAISKYLNAPEEARMTIRSLGDCGYYSRRRSTNRAEALGSGICFIKFFGQTDLIGSQSHKSAQRQNGWQGLATPPSKIISLHLKV